MIETTTLPTTTSTKTAKSATSQDDTTPRSKNSEKTPNNNNNKNTNLPAEDHTGSKSQETIYISGNDYLAYMIKGFPIIYNLFKFLTRIHF